jgi:hypothetical protein
MLEHMHHAADRQHNAIPLGPVMETALRMHTLVASSYARLVALQQEAARLANAEISVYQVELLGAMGAAAQFPWLSMRQLNETSMAELTRAWYELATQAQTALLRVLRGSVLDRDRYLPLIPEREVAASLDRRKTAVVINFPDRRVASVKGWFP